jgi:hypothetical protein
MGQYMLSGTSIISAAGDSVTIRFPKKKMHFCFNHPHDPDARSRSQKVGSLKDFEVCGIPEKEPPHNRQKKLSTCLARSFARCKKESSYISADRVISSSQVTCYKPSVRLEGVKKSSRVLH